jgi:hypothetical protein
MQKSKKPAPFQGYRYKMGSISTAQELTVYQSPANKIIMPNTTAHPGCPKKISNKTPAQAMVYDP